MNRLIAILVAAIVVVAGLCSLANAATPVKLTTPGGVCTFQADSFVASPPSAAGTWGVGCPGYVAPPDTGGGGNPVACGTPVPGRFVVGMKFIPSNLASSASDYGDLFGWAPPGNQSVQTAWPGIASASVIVLTFPNATGYAALKFHTPAGMSLKRSGSWTFTQTGSTVAGNVSVSPCPGVFDATSQKYCWANGGEGQGVSYGNAGAKAAFTCGLVPNTDYYLNLRASPGSACAGGKCSIGIVHRVYGT